ncbi:hypothetical protein AN958_03807 [Leucoagaricus sp. SymC.cos]|nr:hypothetical protein AN958_03807 [Leucoagaricus sp. SymC.cos]
MATLARKALSRQLHSPAFTPFKLHVHPRSDVSDHSRPVSSATPETVVETFSGPSRQRSKFVRQYATSPSDPRVETYSKPSRLQPYYVKHPPFRDLPKQKKKWPYLLAAVVAGVAGWGAFMTYITNQEMVTSSVVRQIMRSVREDPKLREALGEAIRPQPEWWLNGDPKINGRISTLQGNIDVSWRIRGTKSSGTLYFTSIRREKGLPFSILRFKVICDDGTVVLIDAEPV